MLEKVCDGFIRCYIYATTSVGEVHLCALFIFSFNTVSFGLPQFVMEYPQNTDVLPLKIIEDLWWKPLKSLKICIGSSSFLLLQSVLHCSYLR